MNRHEDGSYGYHKKYVSTGGGKAVRCERCGKRHRGQRNWNAVMKAGVITGHLCPACQTPEENAEAEINEATLEYGTDEKGRVWGRAKRG